MKGKIKETWDVCIIFLILLVFAGIGNLAITTFDTRLTVIETDTETLKRSHALLESRQQTLKGIACGYCHDKPIRWRE